MLHNSAVVGVLPINFLINRWSRHWFLAAWTIAVQRCVAFWCRRLYLIDNSAAHWSGVITWHRLVQNCAVWVEPIPSGSRWRFYCCLLDIASRHLSSTWHRVTKVEAKRWPRSSAVLGSTFLPRLRLLTVGSLSLLSSGNGHGVPHKYCEYLTSTHECRCAQHRRWRHFNSRWKLFYFVCIVSNSNKIFLS